MYLESESFPVDMGPLGADALIALLKQRKWYAEAKRLIECWVSPVKERGMGSKVQ